MTEIHQKYLCRHQEVDEPGTPANPVVVVDAPCGAGKTSWAIDFMRKAEGPFMFVTPFKKEINNRILPTMKAQNFVKPERKPNKRKHLIGLLAEHKNIACTHELFRQIGREAIELIQAAGYTLILDEVMQVLEPVSIGAKDRKMLFENGILELQEDGRTVVAPCSDAYLSDKDNRFRDLVRVATHDRLALADDNLLLWLFPEKVFAAFHQVFNLTYLYDAQMQALYYQLNGVVIAKKSVTKSQDTGSYQLVDYLPGHDSAFRHQLAAKVALYGGKYNDIGKRRTALSKSWFQHAKKPLIDSLGRNIRNFCLSKKAKAADTLWTVFKDWKARTPVNGFASGFLSSNARATNDYRDRSVLAYCCNVFMDPRIVRWFESEGCKVDSEAFAASTLIQWICRSQIREGKPVALYLPSRRMRGIYDDYLHGKYS